MPSESQKDPNTQALAFFDGVLSKQAWNRRSDQIAREAGVDLGERLRAMENPAFQIGLAEALGRAKARQRRSPTPAKRRDAKRIPIDEQIARRVLKRQRRIAVIFLKTLRLSGELKELVEIERRIGEGTHLAGKHAAFSARNLMHGLADYLLPPTSETWRDRDGRNHLLGAKNHKNRLIAYASKQLNGRWEAHEYRAFIGAMDLVMRWTGSGPHGAYELHEGEYMYTRLLDALATLARAHAAD